MRQLKILGAALVAIFAFGIMASSALALPDLHCLKSEETKCYPLHLLFSDDGITATQLQSTGGGLVSGKGVSLLFLTTELSSLGTFGAIFLNAAKGATKCNSKGDAAGAVVTKGQFHVVWWSLSPLRTGIAFLPEHVVFECGAAKVEVLGCALSTLEPEHPSGTELDVTAFNGALAGASGKNTLTEYYNDSANKVSCILLSEFGTGFKQSSEVVPTVLIAVLDGKMVTILNE